jgi:GxxExxY protein
MPELLLKDEVYEVVGAALEVYYQLGCGFLEPVYQEAMDIELGSRGIPFEPQQYLSIHYKGRELDQKYRPDFICFGKIIVELKACEGITGKDVAQVVNYLKITRMRVGLLFNFGREAKLEWKRYVL